MWRGGPRTLSRTTDTNLDCAFVENVLSFVALKIGWAWAHLVPLSAPLLRRTLVGLTLQTKNQMGIICINGHTFKDLLIC